LIVEKSAYLSIYEATVSLDKVYTKQLRSSADAHKPEAFRDQSRSQNTVSFHMLGIGVK